MLFQIQIVHCYYTLKYNCLFTQIHLSRHAATHQQITFDCDLCDKTFKEKRLLKQHEVVHTNDEPYRCQLCGKTFKHNNQLYRHKKKYH